MKTSILIGIVKKLDRKKILPPETLTDTKLERHLGTLDLTLLGIGSTLGVGIYVLAGSVARDTAGPAVVLSFLLAAIASIFAGIFYVNYSYYYY